METSEIAEILPSRIHFFFLFSLSSMIFCICNFSPVIICTKYSENQAVFLLFKKKKKKNRFAIQTCKMEDLCYIKTEKNS